MRLFQRGDLPQPSGHPYNPLDPRYEDVQELVQFVQTMYPRTGSQGGIPPCEKEAKEPSRQSAIPTRYFSTQEAGAEPSSNVPHLLTGFQGDVIAVVVGIEGA